MHTSPIPPDAALSALSIRVSLRLLSVSGQLCTQTLPSVEVLGCTD